MGYKMLLPLLRDSTTCPTLLLLLLDVGAVVLAGMAPTHAPHSSTEEAFPEPSPPPGSSQGPSIDHSGDGKVTAVTGTTAILTCRVNNIGNKTVSWIRHRDLHLLAVGRFTYTTDQRFVAMHSPDSKDWLLKIRYIQTRDAGMYECQISTTPPSSRLIHLAVVEPETVIVGGPDVYINVGSRLVLTCMVKFTPVPPAYIFWYHDDKLVSYERTRGGGSSSGSSGQGGLEVSTERGEVTTSSLLVQSARQSHSGQYTCTPANSRAASVTVHVLQGDRPEAIVHDTAATLTLHPHLLLLPLLVMLPLPSFPFTAAVPTH